MPTVGDILRAEREKQGLTVKDIEKSTSIRALYIQAIEDGKYDVLPGEVYLKGFMRNYASFLGLDAQRVIELYRESQGPQTPAPAADAPAPVPSAAPKPPAAKAEQKRPGRESEGKSSVWRWLIALVVIALIGAGAWAAMNYLNPSAPPPPKPPQAQVQPPPAQVQPAPAPPKPATPAPAHPIIVTAKYTADCWTYVTADGREVYEGIPRAGEQLTWNANQSMTVKLGNAAGVALTYNGQPQGRLGGDGDVISKTFAVNTTTTTPPAATPPTTTPR